MKKGDFFVIIIAVVLVIAWMLISHEGSVAAIYVDGELYKRIPLSEDSQVVVESEYGTNTVVVKDGKVNVINASCDGKDCESESISETAHSIVCLPNRLCIMIEESKTENETDVIV